jgi:uncharacterized repeat protein (TIGR01451 family)
MYKTSNIKFIALLLLTLAVILSFGVEDVVADNVDNLAPEITDIQPISTSNITIPDNPESKTDKTPEITNIQPTTPIIADNAISSTSLPSTTPTPKVNNSIAITTITSTTTTVKDKLINIQTTSTLNQPNNNLNLKNGNPNGNILNILSSFLSLPSLNIPQLVNPTPDLTITTESTVSPFIQLFLAIDNSEIQTIISNIQIDQQFSLNNNFKSVLSNKRNFKPVTANNIAITPLTKNTILNDALNVSPTINTDLSVNMDYTKDLTDYKKLGYNTNDHKIIYGTDTILYTINVTNNGQEDAKNVLIYDLLSSSLTFIKADASKGSYNDNTGEWQVKNLSKGSSETLKIKVKVSRSGYISNQAQIKVIDENPTNNIISKNVQAHNPVILVNGFEDDTGTWSDLSKILKQKGIKHFIFNYSQTRTDEPYNVAHNLFEPYVNNLKNTQGYQGKFDIVCHSTGALLTRFYMEDNGNKNSANVGQWIGIGPVNQGIAVEDLIANPDLNPEIAYRINQYSLFYRIIPSDSQAAIHIQTTDPKIIELNKDGLAPNIIYRVIMGVNAQEIPGLDTVGKFGDTYKFTSLGDGIIANEQSILPAAASTNIVNGVKHSKLPQSHEVEDIIVNYLKTTENSIRI